MRPIVDAVRRPLFAVVLVLAALALAGTAAADRSGGASASGEVVVKKGDRGKAVRQVQEALGIAADGVFGPQTHRAVKSFQRQKGLVVDGIVGPQTRAALGLAPFARGSVRGGADELKLPRILRQIAECESGGNPRAVSPGGRYRGKYQFSRDTWENLGGEGDPADASEAEQDRLALKLYRKHGAAPWPNCP